MADPSQLRTRGVQKVPGRIEDLVQTAHEPTEVLELEPKPIQARKPICNLPPIEHTADPGTHQEEAPEFQQLDWLEKIPFDWKPGQKRIKFAHLDRTGIVAGEASVPRLPDQIDFPFDGLSIGQRNKQGCPAAAAHRMGAIDHHLANFGEL